MSVFNNIQNALNIKLNSLSGLPTIYWPNDAKEPAQGTNYIRATLIPSSSDNFTINDGNMHSGIYQVDIFTTLKKGTSEALLLADVVRDGFLRQRLANNGTVVQIANISMSQARRDEAWWHVYVEVNYISVA